MMGVVTLGEHFNPRGNAIGFLRLAFALTVVVSHSWPLGGYGADPGTPGINPGILAVDGFFVLSGFLITASAARTNVGRFMWHRGLRIMPGFWVALLAIVLVFAPAASGRRSPDSGPFLLHNAGLWIGQTTIGGTLTGNPYSAAWTGPLYTLAIEFGCYLLVAALATTRMLRPVPLVAVTSASLAWLMLVLAHPVADYRLARFPFAFMLGALLWVFADRIPVTRLVALTAGALFAATVFTADYRAFVLFGLPVFAYLVVAAATVLPMRRVGRRRDLSYGVYLYGWPVLQVLAAWGLNGAPLPVYLSAAIGLSLGCAWLSWTLVESRALRLKRVGLRSLVRELDDNHVVVAEPAS